MINYRMCRAAGTHRVHGLLSAITGAETHETHDDIVWTAHARAPVGNTNAITWRRLTRNGDIAVVHNTLRLQPNHTGNFEDDCSRSAGFNCRAITARSGIIQVCHFHHHAAPPTAGKTSVAFRTRKCQMPRPEHPDRACGHVAQSIQFINAPVISQKTAKCGHRIIGGHLIALKFRRGMRGAHDRCLISSKVYIVGNRITGNGRTP